MIYRGWFCLLFCLSVGLLRGQVQVWPGDANNNGIVNNVDLLYVGAAFGASGEARGSGSSQFSFELNNFNTIDVVDFAWDFGDGTISTASNPVHNYSEEGNFLVRLQLTRSDGSVCFAYDQLTVGSEVSSNCSIDLNFQEGSTSTELNWEAAISGAPTTTYLWDFGDGLVSNEASPAHEYPEPGDYLTCLIAIDSSGNSCSACQAVTVGANNVDPPCVVEMNTRAAEVGIQFTAQVLGQLWDAEFPNGVNFGYADCDGNGVVNENDVLAISDNYDFLHNTVQREPFIEGMAGVDPGFRLDAGTLDTVLIEGSTVEIPFLLGTASLPVQDFYGLAFIIEYDSSLIVKESVEVDFILNSWINPDNSGLLSIQYNRTGAGQLELAITRKDQETISGFGPIGKLKFIIEDNIGSFLKADPYLDIKVKDMMLIDENLSVKPLVKDSIRLLVDELSGTEPPAPPGWQLQLYPNPASGAVVLQSGQLAMNKLELYNSLGQLLIRKTLPALRQAELPLGGLPPGLYFLQVFTDQGVVGKKLIVK